MPAKAARKRPWRKTWRLVAATAVLGWSGEHLANAAFISSDPADPNCTAPDAETLYPATFGQDAGVYPSDFSVEQIGLGSGFTPDGVNQGNDLAFDGTAYLPGMSGIGATACQQPDYSWDCYGNSDGVISLAAPSPQTTIESIPVAQSAWATTGYQNWPAPQSCPGAGLAGAAAIINFDGGIASASTTAFSGSSSLGAAGFNQGNSCAIAAVTGGSLPLNPGAGAAVIYNSGNPVLASPVPLNYNFAARRSPVSAVARAPITHAAKNAAFAPNIVQDTLTESSNWSGYYASAPSGEDFTDISSTWVVPTIVAPSSGTTYSATWIGFDGASNSTVEQCGTLAYASHGGTPTYYAWYEFYPKASQEISLTVNPGDTLSAEITYEPTESSSGHYAYYFDMTDETTGLSYTKTLYTSSNDARESAEWIEEAPSVGGSIATLSDFGSATFTGDLAALDSSSDQALNALNYNEFEIVQGGNVVALPTAINSTGEAFTINYGGTPPSITWDNASAPSPNDGQTWDVSNNYNWQNGTFNTVYTDGAFVTFNDANNGQYAVTLNLTVSPGSVTVDNSSGNYTISGTGCIAGTGSLTKSGTDVLTLETSNTYSGGTTINSGTLVANIASALPAGGPVVNNGNVIVNADSTVGAVSGTGAMTIASAATFTAADFTQASLANAGTVNFNGTTATVSGNVSGTGILSVSSATAFTASGSFTQAALVNNGTTQINGTGTIGAGGVTGSGTLNIGNGSSSNVVALALSSVQGTQKAINVASGATLDITNNSIVLTPTAGTQATELAYYLGLVKQGYSGGSWTGTGITSSTVALANLVAPLYGIAVAEDDGSYGTVTGLASGQIEIAEAVIGDATLSGTVNFADFVKVEGNYGLTGADWDEGDFFYTGTVNFADFVAVEANFGDTNAISAPEMAAMQSFAGTFGDTLVANPDGVGFQVVSVPEPASLGLLALAGVGILARRRRREAN